MASDGRDARNVWSAQETEGFAMPIEEIRARSTKLQSKVRHRNAWEYAAALVVVAAFGCYAWFLPGLLLKTGSVLVILGTMVVVWQLHWRASAETPPLGDSVMEHLAFQRRELARQRDALRSVALWYLGPFVPGFTLFLLGLYQRVPPNHAVPAALHATIGLSVAVFVGVWVLNRWGAARIQKQIDALDRGPE